MPGRTIRRRSGPRCVRNAPSPRGILDFDPFAGATQPDLPSGVFLAMSARIYQIQKNAMQSVKALTRKWVLEYVAAEAKKPDPLSGWAGSGDTKQQIGRAHV